jgi:hypothetical protein
MTGDMGLAQQLSELSIGEVSGHHKERGAQANRITELEKTRQAIPQKWVFTKHRWQPVDGPVVAYTIQVDGDAGETA